MFIDPEKLTPGVINPIAEHAFSMGACGALAIAIHEETGWPIYAVTDAHNILDDNRAGGGSALHWVVRMPEGYYLDIDGIHSEDELVERYECDADDGEAAVGLSTRADCWEWYGEAQGEPIPVSLARTFVQAVVTQGRGQIEAVNSGPSL